MKSNHRVNIVRLEEPRVHTNADALELFDIEGYQVVVRKGQFKAGDLAVYVQPDSVVPQTEPFKFIWENYVTLDGTVPERKRRVTVRKFRKEWSEGLLMPLSDFPEFGPFQGKCHYSDYEPGTDVSETLNITHYDPPEPGEPLGAPKKQYKWPPKSLRGWMWFILRFFGIELNGQLGGLQEKAPRNAPPVYDVEALKNHANTFIPGEEVVVTEKIHGSSGRYLYQDGKMYVGSRKLWKSPKSSCIWRRVLEQNPWIIAWCSNHEGYTLYGEVTPTQTGYRYGCAEGEVRFFPFDILSPDGRWLNWQEQYDIAPTTWVPTLYIGGFDLGSIKNLADGPSRVGAHAREGIVIRPVINRDIRGIGRLQLKLISNVFLEKDNK